MDFPSVIIFYPFQDKDLRLQMQGEEIHRFFEQFSAKNFKQPYAIVQEMRRQYQEIVYYYICSKRTEEEDRMKKEELVVNAKQVHHGAKH